MGNGGERGPCREGEIPKSAAGGEKMNTELGVDSIGIYNLSEEGRRGGTRKWVERGIGKIRENNQKNRCKATYQSVYFKEGEEAQKRKRMAKERGPSRQRGNEKSLRNKLQGGKGGGGKGRPHLLKGEGREKGEKVM